MSGHSHTHLAGKKYASSHTTVTPAARSICKLLETIDGVDKIALGIITGGLKTKQSVSLIIRSTPTHLLLTVKGNMKAQEIRVYGNTLTEVSSKLALVAQNERFEVVRR